jgi:DNA-binding protein HU-beta
VTKKDLIAHVADNAEITKKEAGVAVDAVLDGIKQSLSKGDKVSLVGFGTFSVKHRKSRTGVNPITKKKMTYPAKKVPHFKPGKGLKESV